MSKFGYYLTRISPKISILLLCCISWQPIYSQSDTIVKEEFLNVCTLMVNPESYAFEGGNISYYDRYTGNKTDSLPFTIDIHYPTDVGRITFIIDINKDSIFDATIVYMGNTHIHHPNDFSFDSPFNNSNFHTTCPTLVEYFNSYGSRVNVNENPIFKEKADSAWANIDSLEIVKLFAQKDYKVGIFYLPDDYCFSTPSQSKWVIFLYYNNKMFSVHKLQNSQIIIYPNPFQNTIYINPKNTKFQNVTVDLINVNGQTIFERQIQLIGITSIEIPTIQPGIYMFRIVGESFIHNQLIIKN